MAQYLISDNVLTDIADAIRNKLGTTETYKPINMKSAINSISTGGGGTTINNQSLTVTPSESQQSFNIQSPYTGYNPVTVKGDANLIAGNIKSGVTIFGITGTYEASGGGQTSSINIQIAAGGNRVSTTSYSAVSGQTLTVQKTGTYDVYWSGFRSSTSGTNGSQLYIDGTAYGSANTTFTNHGQYIHLTNVSLTKDSVIAVRARARTTSYYMYVSNLTIIEQTA